MTPTNKTEGYTVKKAKAYTSIQVKFFTFDQNVAISLKYIRTEFELFALSRFQDIAVQS